LIQLAAKADPKVARTTPVATNLLKPANAPAVPIANALSASSRRAPRTRPRKWRTRYRQRGFGTICDTRHRLSDALLRARL